MPYKPRLVAGYGSAPDGWMRHQHRYRTFHRKRDETPAPSPPGL